MSQKCLNNIDVVVLAGGLGTRISSVLKDTPKILAPVGGRPYILFLVSWLKSFGARRVVFGLGHLAGAVAEYLEENPVSDMEFVTVVEQNPLGTGGAIANVSSSIRSNPALVMNGDSFVDANLCEFVDRHIQSESDASILCTEVADASRYGTVLLDANGRIEKFQEKDQTAGAGYINAGVYLFSPETLQTIAQSGPSLEEDFFQQQPAGRLNALAGHYTFLDIGTPEDLARAPDILGKYYK